MRKRARIAGLVIAVIIILVAVSPKLSGLYFESQYRRIVNYYNQNPYVSIQIKKFQNGWFSSDAVVLLTITDPKIKNYFQSINIPFATHWLIDQHIEHGPIMYHPVDGLHSIFGLALIHNKIRVPDEIASYLKTLGITQQFVEKNEDFVNFSGHFFKYFKTNSLDLTFPNSNHLKIKIHSFETRYWIYPDTMRINGLAVIKKIEVADDEDVITVPKIQIEFDQHQSLQNLWLGNDSITIPDFLWTEVGGKKLSITGIHLFGFANQTTGLFSGNRSFSIEKIDWDGEAIGPIRLQLSINKLNAEALTKMISTYNEVMQRGELYQSQLQQKMMTLLPNLITRGTSINLDSFFKTPLGMMDAHGKIEWPESSEMTLEDDIAQIFTAAHSTLDLKVTKKLLDQFINFASGLSFMTQANPEIRAAYLKAKEELFFVTRQNAYLLSQLVNEGALAKKNASSLLTLQENFAPLSDYQEIIRQLLLDKAISLATSYQLYWQYSEVERPFRMMQDLIKSNQDTIAKNMRAQLLQLKQAGYIEEKDNMITMMVDYSQGKLTINGK